jgi:hypothetical protein
MRVASLFLFSDSIASFALYFEVLRFTTSILHTIFFCIRVDMGI